MRVVKAERWHKVERPENPMAEATSPARSCSVCGSQHLTSPGQTVVDAGTLARYRVVRCAGCGYDLLEPTNAALAAAS